MIKSESDGKEFSFELLKCIIVKVSEKFEVFCLVMLKIKLYTCQGEIKSLITILKVKILVSVSVLKFVYILLIPFLHNKRYFHLWKNKFDACARTAGECRNTCK